jgi:hypothetical protein
MLASVHHLQSASRKAVLSKNAVHTVTRRGYSAQEAKQEGSRSVEDVAHLYDSHATVPNQFAVDAVDARRKRKLGELEQAMWRFVKTTPRNTVLVLRSKEKVFKASTLNVALGSLQRRHPLLQSVLMSLPVVGPYFAKSGAPVIVRELAARELLGESAEKTFLQHEQGVVDNELNAKFQSPYTDFLDRLASAGAQQLIDESLVKKGEIEESALGTKQQLMQQVPQLPLLRATLVNGSVGQSLILTLPSIIADGPSAANLAKELLDQVEKVEESEARGETALEPLYLPCMNSMDEFYPKRVGGIGATFSNFVSFLGWVRYFFKLKGENNEKFHAWIPNESRVIRSFSAAIDASVVENLKSAAKAHDVTLGHALAAATVAATHEVFFSDSDSAAIPTQVWVNLRPHFDAPIESKHLGLLTGRIQGLVHSKVGDDLWQLAKQVKSFDSQIPDEAFRSNKWLSRLVEFDRKIAGAKPPNEKPLGPLLQTAPATIGNMGLLDLPKSLADHFKLDAAATYFGQSENTRFTSFTSLPNGKLSVTVTFPDLIFKRSDMSLYMDAIAQHIRETAEGK